MFAQKFDEKSAKRCNHETIASASNMANTQHDAI